MSHEALYEQQHRRLTPCPDCHQREHLRCVCGGDMCWHFCFDDETGLRGWVCRQCGAALAPGCDAVDMWLIPGSVYHPRQIRRLFRDTDGNYASLAEGWYT